ncbi:uncharacterized protein LOC134202693 [Armigeres subalbatus]|uniref:uncharacterized protein LOC134202693 n=1 Tax=Armigeres subalbatus TaxID=124917 RepID=UPI002ED49D02
MVLLMDEQLPPLKWNLGRVTEVFRGSDDNIFVVDVRTSSGDNLTFNLRILDCDSFTLIWIVEEAGVVHFSSRREVISKFLARIVSFPLNVLSVESVRVWSEIQICGKCAKARYLTSISQRQLLTPLCSVKVSRRSTLPEGAATVNFAPRQGEGKE